MSVPRSARLILPALTAAGALALAACSSSGGSASGSGNPSHSPSAAAAGGTAAVVHIRSTSAGQVLTDAAGHTLYVSDQENGMVLCRSAACTSVWVPLTVTGNTAPSAPAGVTLSVITRPGGTHQVTFHGRPLYTFSFDRAAGATGGNGQMDSFDGTQFSWHAAVTGPGGAPSSPAASSSSTGYHY
jgi:predicted lipoprotein with Yx(FWY)xxD motif